jgi:hypothetical protein
LLLLLLCLQLLCCLQLCLLLSILGSWRSRHLCQHLLLQVQHGLQRQLWQDPAAVNSRSSAAAGSHQLLKTAELLLLLQLQLLLQLLLLQLQQQCLWQGCRPLCTGCSCCGSCCCCCGSQRCCGRGHW